MNQRPAGEHLANVAANLQLIADLSYGTLTLAVVGPTGALEVVADARPITAMSPRAGSRAGKLLDRADEPEAYEALAHDRCVPAGRARSAHGLAYTTSACPIGSPEVIAVVLRDLTEQMSGAAGRMETAFMAAAEELLAMLRRGPYRNVRDGRPFATTRSAGDGVMRVDAHGRVGYASPNAVSIMRLAGVEGRVTGRSVVELPGGNVGISPVLGAQEALAVAVEAEVAERVLGYRTLAVESGGVVLVEDLTQARAREHEIRVKQTTIREIHHRVKNNLQTIASLLRMQARRSEHAESRRALSEAIERVSSMAVVHDMLAGSEGERIDFAAAATTIVDLVRRGLVGEAQDIAIDVRGETGVVDARVATALAMALAELVHNALEHGFEPGAPGRVEVRLSRTPDSLVVTVRDDGRGLPPDFDPHRSASLGLTIVRTVVEDDLRGTLCWNDAAEGVAERGPGRPSGTRVTIDVPLAAERDAATGEVG